MIRYLLLYLIVAFTVVLFLFLAFQTVEVGYVRLPGWIVPIGVLAW